jgi:putative Mn2+ efflux pump MntP
LTRLVVIVLPLCVDTFAASAALGLAGLTARQRLQVSILFPIAEAAMPLLGVALGLGAAHVVGDVASYVAAVVLAAVGAFLLAEADDRDEEHAWQTARGWALVGLTLGIAVDELALGVGIGLLRLSLTAAVIMIAVQAVVASQLGLLVGARLGARAREGAQRLAGFALVAIGVFLFFERLA